MRNPEERQNGTTILWKTISPTDRQAKEIEKNQKPYRGRQSKSPTEVVGTNPVPGTKPYRGRYKSKALQR